MALDFFRIEKGLSINNDEFLLLEGAGAPGGTPDTDAAPVGSVYSDTTGGVLYVKNTAGSGSDKWAEQATKDYVDSTVSGQDAELGYLDAFVGKAEGNEMPNYSSNNFVVDGTSLEAAVGALDAELGANVTDGEHVLAASKVNENIQSLDTALTAVTKKVTASNVTTVVTLDSVPLAAADFVKWAVVAVNAADSTNKYAAELDAVHDGSSVADYNKFGVVKVGAVIDGLSFSVDVSGGNLRLRVVSTTAVNVKARRITAV